MIRAMKSASDIWVCGKCRSINPLSRGRCYRCNTPIEVAAAKPEDLAFEHHEVAPEPTGVFRASESLAVIVTVAVVAFNLATLVALWINWTATELRAADWLAASRALLAERLPIIALAPIFGVVALVAFGTWIRRIVENLPALGVGYSRVSPTWAFFEPLIPGFNLYAIPARMGEAIQKLGPHPLAMPLLGLALIFAFGPPIVVGVLLRFTGFFGSGADLRAAIAIGLILVFVCQAIALSIGLVVLWMIEGLQRSKHDSLTAAPATPTSGDREPLRGLRPLQLDAVKPVVDQRGEQDGLLEGQRMPGAVENREGPARE